MDVNETKDWVIYRYQGIIGFTFSSPWVTTAMEEMVDFAFLDPQPGRAVVKLPSAQVSTSKLEPMVEWQKAEWLSTVFSFDPGLVVLLANKNGVTRFVIRSLMEKNIPIFRGEIVRNTNLPWIDDTNIDLFMNLYREEKPNISTIIQ